MADVQDNKNSLWRRDEQIRRYNLSETNRESSEPKHPELTRVKFEDSYVILAAISSGDIEEVEVLLSKGADINTANIDGLTGLHQACIDDNLEMVRFLVEHKADINASDNEGWTPLHATASCGLMEVAKYLIDKGADIAAVNNDGELALDLADGDDMEELLQDEMDKQGVDADAARDKEENMMLHDANQWLSNGYDEEPHYKTGATSLHCAAAKGYTKVMEVLIQAHANIDAQDFDGWTPLHAAAHWGMDDACKVLVENLCNMDIKNNAGQTAMDIVHSDIKDILKELKEKQVLLHREERIRDLTNRSAGIPYKRRSSVTRMSVDQKQNIVRSNVEEERQMMQNKVVVEEDHKSSESSEADETGEDESGTSESSSDSETEKKNEINRQTSLNNNQSNRQKSRLTSTLSGDSLETKNRSYLPPARDEEKEVERKARARYMRETRRSTQGITREDIEKAEQEMKAAQDKDKSRLGSSDTKDRGRLSSDDKSDKENKPDASKSTSSSSLLRHRGITDDKSTSDAQSVHSRLSNRDSALTADSCNIASSYSRNSIRGTPGSSTTSSITTTTTSTTSVPAATTSTTVSSATSSLTPYSYRSKYLRSEDSDASSGPERRTSEDRSQEESPSQKSTAIRTKRKRESRKATGVVNPEDIQAAKQQESETKDKPKEESNRYNRYNTEGSGSSLKDGSSSSSSRFSARDRPSSYHAGSGYTRSQSSNSLPDKDIDYKRLYEEQKAENEKLRKDVKKLQQELSDTKVDLEKVRLRSEPTRPSETAAERKEKRTLERKISELEEELRQMENLKQDNQRLKEENGALIRVISKLSK